MIFKQFRRVRIAYRCSRFSDGLSLQKVRDAYPTRLNRYKEVVHEVVEHRSPKDIMAKLAELETEIQAGMKKLEGMLE